MKNFTLKLQILLLFFGVLWCAQSSYAQDNTITFDDGDVGSNNFTVPAGQTYLVTVYVWGAGGRGGTRTTNGEGGGGGGGGYTRTTLLLTAGTYKAVVGAGATGTTPGGDSYFTNNAGTTTYILAKGGNSVANNTTGGAAGGNSGSGIATGTGNLFYSGGNGANASGSDAGGGGSSAGTGANGANATDEDGANAPTNGGDGGDGVSTGQGDGDDGENPGGGGGGARRSSSGTRTGGSGADGQIIITWDDPNISVQGVNGANIGDGDDTGDLSTPKGTIFGSTDVSSGTITKTFTIENTGEGPLYITDITFSGANAADFSVTAWPTSPVAEDDTTTFTVTFNPSAEGTRNAVIHIISNDPDAEGDYTFAIRGTGITPEINLVGNGNNITNGDSTPIATDNTNFGSVDITSGSVIKTFTIQNIAGSTGLLTIGTISFSGSGMAAFNITASPAASVTAGNSTTFTVTFDPSILGVSTAIISIPNNDTNENPYTFTITGTGTGVSPEINLIGNGNSITSGDVTPSVPDNTNFGSMDVTSGTIAKTFTIDNSAGTAQLTVGTITFSGAAFADFTVTSLPTSPIVVGGSTTFIVTFNPSAIGARNAIISIPNNDSNENPYTFSITGNGITPEINLIGNGNSIANGDGTPSPTDNTNFGSVDAASGTIAKTFTIDNSAGTEALTVGTISFSGAALSDFTVTAFPTTPVAAGGSTTFTVTFDPGAVGVRNAIISIPNNDTDENPYTFSITGNGTVNPEINIQGNGISIVDGDATPNLTDNTNFGGQYVLTGSISKTFTIQNTGLASLTLTTTITIGGTNAADFSIISSPTSPVAIGGTTTFTVKFDPNGSGTRNATISIVNNDPDENPYDFSISGTGNMYLDSDGDGITDETDIDDDNDGIKDTDEQTACLSSTNPQSAEVIFLNETFGTGTTRTLIDNNITTASTQYTPSPSGDVNDGSYTVINTAQITSWAANYWWQGSDHTGDTNGKMAVFNADNVAGKVFYTTVLNGITPGIPMKYSFWVINLDRSNNPDGNTRSKPNLTVQFKKIDNSVITSATLNTGNIPLSIPNPGANWVYYERTFTPTEATVTVVFTNNAVGGAGNDLALDDIKVTQTYCDLDSDGNADIFDLDDDNDGIPDIVEAGFKAYSNNKSRMDIETPSVWKDINGNGMHDDIDTFILNGTYNNGSLYLLDSDGDGTKDFMDLDSDNDSIFDIDEAQKDTFSATYNGDGDIDGDGKGDGSDTDKDGLKDLNDDLVNAYGTTNKPYPVNSDGDGLPDYLDLTSNGTAKDIAGTIYTSLDANYDGEIDATTDADKDGVIDSLDGDTTASGSPRNLTNRKLLIDFDGRNDYAEGDQLLSGLSSATIMGWVKLDTDYPSTVAIVLGQSNFYIAISGSATRNVTAIAGSYNATWPTSLEVNRWYHIAATYDNAGGIKLYVNGSLKQTSSVSGNLAASTSKFTIGRKAGASSNYFRGYVDEVRVFNKALTDDQLQKMVYQKITQNGTAVRGMVIPKDIESSTWTNLKAYYRMDDYKGNVTDDYTIAGTDNGSSSTFCKIYNVKYIKAENTPLPFVTKQAGALDSDAITDTTNFIYGPDVTANNFSIIQVKHDVTLGNNLTNIGLIVDSGKTISVSNNNKIENSWYLELNGKIDLVGKSQLVQGASSSLTLGASALLERDQQGTGNKYNYNYWSSPVSTSASNGTYTVDGVMKDGSNPSSILPITWTTSYDGVPGSPGVAITLSNQWIYKFQNLTPDSSNWSDVGQDGLLSAGMAYTLKGDDNALNAAQNYTFVGKPNNGTINIPVTAGNLVMIGNPYPSAIDASAFIKDNMAGGLGTNTTIDGNLYFWQHSVDNNTHTLAGYIGGYAARNLTDAVGVISPTQVSGSGDITTYPAPGQYIPVGQGFFVVGINTGNVSFKNNYRIFKKENDSESNYMLRASNSNTNNEDQTSDEPDHFIKVRLGFNSNENFHRQIVIGFMNENASDAIEIGYDAEIFDDYTEDMAFRTDGRNLIIQGVGEFSTSAIYPLFVKTAVTGNVQFTLDGTKYFDGYNALIYDATTNEYHNISEGIAELPLEAGTYTDRFSLRFQESTLGIETPNTDESIKVIYASKTGILTIENNLLDATVEAAGLFNMIGQQISNWDLSNKNQQKIEIPINGISSGTYIVKIKTNNGNLAKKVVIK